MSMAEHDTGDAPAGGAPDGRSLQGGGGHRPPVREGWLWAGLFGIGIAWGSTQPLAKFGMEAGHHPVGVTFWQALIGLTILGIFLALRGRRIPLGPRYLAFYAVCGVLGTALPSTLSYEGIKHLPVGVQSLVLATVPMMTLLLAMPMRLERAGPKRIAGIGLGLTGILMIVGPDTSLPDPSQAIWVTLPLMVALSYAAENVIIARWMPAGIDPAQTMAGLLMASLVFLVPAMVAMDGVPDLGDPGWREAALAVGSILNVGCYMGFIWLISRGGAVFASQVGYVVTATGVISGMIFLGERHSLWIWAALAVLFAGLALVSPKRDGAVVTPPDGSTR